MGLGEAEVPPPIAEGQRLRALAVAMPYDSGKIYKFLVKRVSHRDLIGFVEGREVVAI